MTFEEYELLKSIVQDELREIFPYLDCPACKKHCRFAKMVIWEVEDDRKDETILKCFHCNATFRETLERI